MSKINFDQVLKDFDGNPLLDGQQKSTTLSEVCITAMMTMEPGVPPTGEGSFKRATLAHSLHGGGEIELTSEDIAMIKERIGAIYPPAVVFAAYNMLESVH